MAKFCGKCGAALNDRGLCPVCDGASLQPKAPGQPVQPVRAVQPEKPAQTLKPMQPAKSVQPAGKKTKFCGKCGGLTDPETGRCLRCDGARPVAPGAAGQGKRQPSEWKLPEEKLPERKPTEWKLPEQELPKQPPERKPAKKRKPTKKKRHTALRIVLAVMAVLLLAAIIAGAAHFRLIPLKGVIRATEKVENALGITPYGGRKLLSETAYNDDGQLLWTLQYAYGKDGKMSSVTSYGAAGEQTGYVELQYDEKGRQLTNWRQKTDGSVYMPSENQYLSDTERKVIYRESESAGWYDTGWYDIQQLDRNGNATRVEAYNGDGILYDTEYLEYDGEGRLKESRRVYPANGTPIWTNPSHVLCEYSGWTGTEKVYYTEGEPQKSGLYRAGDSWLQQRYDFTYNSRGDMTSWTEYQWSKDTEEMEKAGSRQFSFDRDGTCTGYEVFDGSDQRTMYVEYELQTFKESLKPGAASSGKKPAGADAQSAAGTQNGPITLQQVMDGMEAAADFYDGWFYNQRFVDRNDKVKNAEVTTFDFYFYAVDYHNVHTLEEWKAEARKFYTEDIVNEFAAWDANLGGGFQGWLERDGKLYIARPTGLGDNFLERYHVELVSSTETQAVVSVYDESNIDHSLSKPYTVTCTLENGNLVFDTILDFPQVEPYFVEYDPQSQS